MRFPKLWTRSDRELLVIKLAPLGAIVSVHGTGGFSRLQERIVSCKNIAVRV